jgi:hypothetical protein
MVGKKTTGTAAPTPFEAKAGEAEEGWGSRGVRRRVEGKTEEGFGDVDRHGTDAVTLGHSDSGGWRTPRGCVGRAAKKGGRWGASDARLSG